MHEARWAERRVSGLLSQVEQPGTIRWLRVWVDGGVINANPSPVGVYWSVRVEDDGCPPVVLRRKSDAYTTNNEAEWLALLEALKYLSAHFPGLPAVIHSDSMLIVNQFNGKYAVRDARMHNLWREAREVSASLKLIVRHVPREQIVLKLGH